MVSRFNQTAMQTGILTRVLFGIVGLLLLAGPVFSQKVRQDMVLLKNGELVKGSILSRDPGNTVRIENACGIRMISYAEIDTIISAYTRSTRFSNTKGIYNLSSLTLLFGEGEDGFVPLPSLTTTLGYRFSGRFMAGAGLGFEHYKWPVLPLFVEARYVFRNNDVLLPFVSLRTGGAVPLVSRYDGDYYYGNVSQGKTYGGMMVNPETGFIVPLSEKTGISVSVGYFHQRLSYETQIFDWRFGTNSGTRRIYTYYNRINLRLGLFFI